MHRTAARRQSESARHYVDFSVSDPALSTLTSLAATTLGFGQAMVNILDADTQYTLAQSSGDTMALRPRSTATCAFVVDSAGPVVVPDADRGRFSADPAHAAASESVFAASCGSYVAVPLYGREGLVVGTLCLVDDDPHPADEYTVSTLLEFARLVETHLDGMRARGRSLFSLRDRIVADAVIAGEIVPWFQPVVDLESGTVTAVEALARWHRPTSDGTDITVVSPADFLPSIEGSELEIDVDHAVLVAALVRFESWLAEDVDLHVNLSARHLVTPDAVQFLVGIVSRSAVPAGRVVFELTETRSNADRARAHDFVVALQAEGFRVLLDDIGIGFSSLERLIEYPVDGFKIDAAIARTLGTPAGDSLVRALAGFATDTDRTLVIEGIETDAQLASARRNGCTRVQGFLYSRAVPASDIGVLLG